MCGNRMVERVRCARNAEKAQAVAYPGDTGKLAATGNRDGPQAVNACCEVPGAWGVQLDPPLIEGSSQILAGELTRIPRFNR